MPVTKDIKIESSGSRYIALDIFTPDNKPADHTLIFFHGTKGFKDWGPWPYMYSYFNAKNVALVTVNFSHNGVTTQNPGEFTDLEAFAQNTISLELTEMKLVLDWVSENGAEWQLPLGSINIMGHSRAGGEVILFGTKDSRVHRIIALSPVIDFLRAFKNDDIDQWKTDGFIEMVNTRTNQKMPLNYSFAADILKHEKEFDVAQIASLIDKPLLLIHGQDDDIVPISDSQAIYNQCLHALMVTITNTGHTFSTSHPWNKDTRFPVAFVEMLENVVEFIEG